MPNAHYKGRLARKERLTIHYGNCLLRRGLIAEGDGKGTSMAAATRVLTEVQDDAETVEGLFDQCYREVGADVGSDDLELVTARGAIMGEIQLAELASPVLQRSRLHGPGALPGLAVLVVPSQPLT